MSDQRLVRIMCPSLTCRKVLSIPEIARGRTVRCKACGTTIRVPSNKAASGSSEQVKPDSEG